MGILFWKKKKHDGSKKAITKPEKSKAKPAPKDEEDKQDVPQKYHVSQNKDQATDHYMKWRVRKDHSEKTIQYFDTQKEAIAFAQGLADRHSSSVVIHKLDGSIRKQAYTKKNQ